jgi:hypothetical protein
MEDRTMRKRFLIGVVPLLLAAGPAVADAAVGPAAAGTPWGPTHALHHGRVTASVSQATSSTGMTVVVFRATPHSGPSQVEAAVQLPGQAWGTAIPLSDGKIARPTTVAWGQGNVSVIWQSPAGTDNWLFHIRTVAADGTWGTPEKLTTARFAYPWFQAAMNDKGELALAWVNGDQTGRVEIRHSDGSWTATPAVPVMHPTFHGASFIDNPRELFLTDNGQVTDVTWGTLGSAGRAIWKMRFDADGNWHHQRIGPIDGGSLGYGWVKQANYAADPSGDVAAVWSQRDPSTRLWTTLFRYWPASGPASTVQVLSHLPCGPDWNSCADVEMATDGSTLMAYGVRAGDGSVLVRFMRRSPDGTFSSPQTISDLQYGNAFQGVQLSGNGRGDGLVSFPGGTEQDRYSEFARCPASGSCDQAILRVEGPNWLDLWQTTLGPAGGATVTWTYFYRPQFVNTRHLAAFTGAP